LSVLSFSLNQFGHNLEKLLLFSDYFYAGIIANKKYRHSANITAAKVPAYKN